MPSSVVLRRFVAAFLALFLLHEGAARLWLPPPVAVIERDDWFRGHPYLWHQYSSTRNGGTDVGRYGFRRPEFEWKKAPGVRRIVVVGSSVVYSPNSSAEGSMPALMGRELSTLLPDSRLEVLNAGFHGYTSQMSLVHVATRIVELAPDVVVFYVGDNDFIRNTSIGESSITEADDSSFDWRRDEIVVRSFQDTTPIARALARSCVLLGRPLTRGHIRPSSLENLFIRAPDSTLSPIRDILGGRGRFSAAALLGTATVPERRVDAERRGTRDPAILSRFHERNMRKMVELSQSCGARTVVCTLVVRPDALDPRCFWPGVATDDGRAHLLPVRDAMNANLRRIAVQTGSLLVDFEGVLEPTAKHFSDATHWNEEGGAAGARAVARALAASGWLAKGSR